MLTPDMLHQSVSSLDKLSVLLLVAQEEVESVLKSRANLRVRTLFIFA